MNITEEELGRQVLTALTPDTRLMIEHTARRVVAGAASIDDAMHNISYRTNPHGAAAIIYGRAAVLHAFWINKDG